jgi:hypothetical protein
MLIYVRGAEASGVKGLSGARLASHGGYCAFFIKLIERRDQFEYYVYRRVKALTPALE